LFRVLLSYSVHAVVDKTILECNSTTGYVMGKWYLIGVRLPNNGTLLYFGRWDSIIDHTTSARRTQFFKVEPTDRQSCEAPNKPE